MLPSVSRQMEDQPLNPVLRGQTLMSDREHANFIRLGAVGQGVAIAAQRPTTCLRESRGAKTWHRSKQPNRTLYRRFEISRQRFAALREVPIDGSEQLRKRGGLEAIAHFLPSISMRARTSAKTCSPGIVLVRPASRSATLREISAAQSGCNGIGGSILATNRSARSARCSTGSRSGVSPKALDFLRHKPLPRFTTAPTSTPRGRCCHPKQ